VADSSRAGDRNSDWLAGLLLSIPLPVPVNPIYPFAFTAFGLALLRMRIPAWRLLAFVLLALVGLASSLGSPFVGVLALPRALLSTIFFAFFLFGFGIESRERFARGYVIGVRALAVAILGVFAVTGVWRKGVLLFLVADNRLWGSAIFPAWPNYLAFGLGMGLLLDVVLFRSWRWGVVVAAAAIATTSRTGMLAVALAAGLVGVGLLKNPRWRLPLIALVTIALAALWVVILPQVRLFMESDLVQQRLFRTSDREVIYNFGWNLVARHPVMGVGHVLLEDVFGAPKETFHSAYFDVLVRHGLLGFGLWLALLWPSRGTLSSWSWVTVLGFVLVASAFNTITRHPHYAMLYAGLFLRRPASGPSP
jgi:O-antigen ligase